MLPRTEQATDLADASQSAPPGNGQQVAGQMLLLISESSIPINR